jgi:hypothetical protein
LAEEIIVSLFTAALYYIIASGAAGTLASIISWAAGTEPFNGRKMFVAIATGVGAGFLVGIVEVEKLQSLGVTEIGGFTLLLTIVTIFTSAGFGTFAGSKLAKISAKVQGEKVED